MQRTGQQQPAADGGRTDRIVFFGAMGVRSQGEDHDIGHGPSNRAPGPPPCSWRRSCARHIYGTTRDMPISWKLFLLCNTPPRYSQLDGAAVAYGPFPSVGNDRTSERTQFNQGLSRGKSPGIMPCTSTFVPEGEAPASEAQQYRQARFIRRDIAPARQRELARRLMAMFFASYVHHQMHAPQRSPAWTDASNGTRHRILPASTAADTQGSRTAVARTVGVPTLSATRGVVSDTQKKTLRTGRSCGRVKRVPADGRQSARGRRRDPCSVWSLTERCSSHANACWSYTRVGFASGATPRQHQTRRRIRHRPRRSARMVPFLKNPCEPIRTAPTTRLRLV